MPAINYDKLNLTNIGIVQSDIVSASAIYTNTLSAADSIIVNNILSGNNINLSDRWNTSYTFSNSNSALILGDLTNISVTSATWDISYTNLVGNSAAYLSGANLSEIAAVSANWNTSYTFLTSNSALILGDLTNISVTSANWNNAWTNLVNNSGAYLSGANLSNIAAVSSNWNTSYTFLTSNSALILGDLTDIAVTSATWNTSYTFSNSNSALILGDLTNIANTSATWDTSYTNLVGNSGAYLSGVNLSNIAAVSANWNTSYTFLTSNSALILGDLTNISVTSATWNTSYTFTNSNSALILGDLTVLATNSAYWNPGVGINGGTLFALNSAMIFGDLTDIAVTSANWNNTYTQFSNNSATYATIPYVNSNFLSTSGGIVNGTTSFAQNLSVLGSLFVTGSAVFANALIVTSTSALSVVNTGPGPALFVGQGPGGGDIASFYDNNNGLEVLHVGNDLPYIGKGVIGIRTSDPNETLTVIGGISSTGVISTSAYDSNSNNWTNAWTNLVGNSAAYLSGANLSQIAAVSANWNTSYTFLTSNSALILGDLTDIANTSATWNNAWTNLVNNSGAYLSGANLSQIASVSANWNTSYTFLTSNSALILGDLTNISVTSATWNTSYTFLTSNSALILGDLTNISVTSANWNNAWTNLVGNSAAYLSGANLSQIASVSANWNTSYTFLTSNSALILGDLTNIANTSATWNNAWTNLVGNSGAYLSGANLSQIASVSANWNTSYTFLTSNSALILGDLTNIANTSANWNTSYTFLTSNSALILGDLTNISVTSANWNTSYTNLVGNSAAYLSGANLSQIASVSANWNTSYTFLTSNSALILGDLTNIANTSANWNTSYTFLTSNSALILGDLTNISVTSANWNTSYTFTNSNSALILGDLTVVATNSAFWNPGVGVNGGTLFALNSAMIFGDITNINVTSAKWDSAYSYTNSNSANIVLQNSSPTLSSLTVLGNLSVLGDFTYLDTTVTVTSALSVVNVGTGPALTVKQSGSQPVATFIDAEGGYMTIADTGSVGIGTQSPNEKLSVIGNISASGIVYANLGNSNNWNSSYTFSNSNSALILGDLTVVATNSAYWGNASGGGFVPLSGTNVRSMFGQLSSTASATFSALNITTGNVGIGTSSPAAKLEVTGSIANTNTTTSTNSYTSNLITLTANSAASSATYIASDITATHSGASGAALTGSLIGLRVTAAEYWGSTTNSYAIQSLLLNTLNYQTITNGYNFYANSPSLVANSSITTAYGLYIAQQKVTGVTTGYSIYQANSADINYFAGNVGIGTTSPSNKFVVAGGLGEWRFDPTNITVGSNNAGYATTYCGGLPVDNTASTGGAKMFLGGEARGDGLVSTVAFYRGSTESMRINSSGNVGIGTATPVTKLTVVGNISATGRTFLSAVEFRDGTFQITAAAGGGASGGLYVPLSGTNGGSMFGQLSSTGGATFSALTIGGGSTTIIGTVSTFTNVMTASNDFLLITVSGKTRGIRLYDF